MARDGEHGVWRDDDKRKALKTKIKRETRARSSEAKESTPKHMASHGRPPGFWNTAALCRSSPGSLAE